VRRRQMDVVDDTVADDEQQLTEDVRAEGCT
jgi:hypothetical protein